MSKKLEVITELEAIKLVAADKAAFQGFGYDGQSFLKIKETSELYHRMEKEADYHYIGRLNTRLNKNNLKGG